MKRIFAFILALLCLSMPLTAFAKGDIYQIAEKATYTNADTTLPYRLILPDNYDENAKYPVILFFHGAGERGNDNSLQFTHAVQIIYDNAPEDCIIVAPQCPLDNQWVDTPWGNGSYSVDGVPESNELNAVAELIEQLKETHAVDPDRIYATGLSMGGFGVWDVMIRHNDVFAAGIAICGSGDPSKAEVLKDTPMFVFHGSLDMAVPVTGSREMVEAIQNVGGTSVVYTELKDAGHSIWNKSFLQTNLFDKLFECKLSDRITLPTPENSESESTNDESETLDTSDETNEDTDSDFLTVALIVGGALVGIAIIVAVAVVLIKKKK